MKSTEPNALIADDAHPDDVALVDALKRRDEAAFTRLVEEFHGRLLRLAGMYVDSAAVAEEVVQETWLGVVAGIDAFEARASLTTWLYTICVNRARTRGQRERRSVAFSQLAATDDGDAAPAVAADRFFGASHPQWAGHWTSKPASWGDSPETELLRKESQALIVAAIAQLPATQRTVITLRDIDGLTANEVCNVLGLSETNQRVLLHRARSRVRAALEQHFASD